MVLKAIPGAVDYYLPYNSQLNYEELPKYPARAHCHEVWDHHYYCAPCQRIFSEEAGRQQHWKHHIAHRETYCHRCGFDFRNRQERLQHVHSKPSPHFICMRCSVAYKTIAELRIHYSTSTEHRLTYCSKCAVDFENKDTRLEVGSSAKFERPSMAR